MSGGDVTILQNRLNCFRTSNILRQPATGKFDTHTAAAVLAFKRDAAANGDTGFPDNSIAGFGYYDANWIYALAGGRAIMTGRNGFDVVFVQRFLQTMGSYRGAVTGYYDAATQSAVRAFQAEQNITADGVVGPETFYYIGRSNVQSAPNPLGVAWPSHASQVTVCSVALTSPGGNLTPYGVASVVTNLDAKTRGLDVVVSGLPKPVAPYEGYQMDWEDITQPLDHLDGPSSTSWGGHRDVFYATTPLAGTVTIHAYTAGESQGPTLLRGNLGDCH